MSETDTEWFEDDPTIIDNDTTYRRLSFKLKPAVTVDSASGRILPHASTLQYTSDGLSLLLDSELKRLEILPTSLCTDKQTAFAFTVGILRESGGRIKRDPLLDDPDNHGEAHALAGTHLPPTHRDGKRAWTLVRTALISAAIWVGDPPSSS